MPRPPASPAEIEAARDQMIEGSIALIDEAGFQEFSMRKLGSRLGIAAKTIYNYFADKDELYLAVLSRGFQRLLSEMEDRAAPARNPSDRLLLLGQAYVEFGLANPRYYNVLFSLDLPRFTDYRGTRHEKLAEQQNNEALRVADLAAQCISQIVAENDTDEEEIKYRLMRLWSSLHGIISLVNSRVTLEVGDFSAAIPSLVEDAVNQASGS